MRIRKSNRGLTFSFAENEHFKVGSHYRYFVDVAKSEVIIVADENGKYKLSRKGTNAKPLVDLRNSEIKEAMSLASYMEVEISGDQIIVHIIKKTVNVEGNSDVDVADLFDKGEEISFVINKEDLIENNEALADMLTASGLFSEKTADDLSYVFDTVSLFSGAGLLDYPFHKDDSFDIRFAVDFDASACETYRRNIGDHIWCMDIRDLTEDRVPDADLIIGGPCCQGYSNANRAGNLAQDISKRLLIDDYIRMVRAKKPYMFLIENVEQFITKEQGKYLNRVITELSNEYNITYSVVNDWEVGGYSTRKRMLLIGSIKAIGKVIIPDVELTNKKTVGQALAKVDSSWFNYADITKASPETVAKMAQVPQGGNYKNIRGMELLDRHSNVYRRLDLNKPSVTITNWRKVNLIHPTENRILSVAEASAIMGLGKDFKFYGSINDRQQQVGNGVTQAIASFAKSVIKTHLYAFVNKQIKENKVLAKVKTVALNEFGLKTTPTGQLCLF